VLEYDPIKKKLERCKNLTGPGKRSVVWPRRGGEGAARLTGARSLRFHEAPLLPVAHIRHRAGAQVLGGRNVLAVIVAGAARGSFRSGDPRVARAQAQASTLLTVSPEPTGVPGHVSRHPTLGS